MPLTKIQNTGINTNAVTTEKIAVGTINNSDIAPGVLGTIADKFTNNLVLTGGETSNVIGSNVNFTSGNVTGLTNFQASNVLVSGNITLGQAFFESANIQLSGVGGNVTMNPITSGLLFYTQSATANTTVSIQGVAGLNTGTSTTLVLLMTNGVTAYRVANVYVEGSASNVRWFGGGAPAQGNASNIDVYTFNVIKTGTSSYFTFASQARFG